MSGGKVVSDMDAVRTAEFKEAFDEFDKVYKIIRVEVVIGNRGVIR